MRTMWHRASALAMAPLVMASAVACGGSGSDEAAGGTTLRIIVNISPNLTEQYWKGLFATYEKSHPGVHVKLELTGTVSANAKLTQDLAAGDPPDVAQQIVPAPDTAKLFADLSDQPWAKGTPLVDQYAEKLRMMSSTLPDSWRVELNRQGYPLDRDSAMLLPGTSTDLVGLAFQMYGLTGWTHKR